MDDENFAQNILFTRGRRGKRGHEGKRGPPGLARREGASAFYPSFGSLVSGIIPITNTSAPYFTAGCTTVSPSGIITIGSSGLYSVNAGAGLLNTTGETGDSISLLYNGISLPGSSTAAPQSTGATVNYDFSAPLQLTKGDTLALSITIGCVGGTGIVVGNANLGAVRVA